jgi:ribosomal-protein-alanine N-acetyltransferase
MISLSMERLNVRTRIRPMRLDDIAQVVNIDHLSFSMPWPERSYHFELLENPASRSWIAEVESPEAGQIVVGMIVAWLLVDEAHIATLAVHPEYRGLGIGRALLQTALHECSQMGALLATLEVRETNGIAQQLYRDFGFAETGRRKRYYKDTNEDAVIMSARISVQQSAASDQ